MKPRHLLTTSLPLALAALLVTATAPQAGPGEGDGGADASFWDELHHAVGGGRVWLKARYRYEYVDQDGISNKAHASTVRTLLGYETQAWHNASFLIEFEDVSPVFNDLYNSTINGTTDRPVVADPDGTEVNQAFLRYKCEDGAEARIGRQRIILDNARFVGNVGWRQNEQTYDGVSLQCDKVENLTAYYAYLDNVNRIFGDMSPNGDHRMSSHLVNLGYDIEDVGKATLYGYHLDYDDAHALSSFTIGARLAGKRAMDSADVHYLVEYADQKDAGDNPNDLDASYIHGMIGATVKKVTVKLGLEVLEGGDSGTSDDEFITPLATLHAFNGWADKFLNTPDAGLEDMYISVGGKVAGTKCMLVWHSFEGESGGGDFGSEIDFVASRPWGEHATVGIKLADYSEDGFATDTTKAWVWLGYTP